MKATSILLTAAVLSLSVAPAFSQSKPEKDECLLASQNCVDQVDDIYRRMHRLDKEIRKGKKVYTSAELTNLREKLTQTQELLKTMEKPGR